MAIKKAFQPIVELLEANQKAKVADVLDQVRELAAAKGAGGTATTIHRNEAGEVDYIHCYYFKQWMPVSHVEFGAKKSSASGFDTMCKEGVSNWGRQQRVAKAEKEAVLERVATGELKPEAIQAELDAIEARRVAIKPKSDGIGFETLEEAMAVTTEELDAMAAAYQEKLAAEVAAADTTDEEAAE